MTVIYFTEINISITYLKYYGQIFQKIFRVSLWRRTWQQLSYKPLHFRALSWFFRQVSTYDEAIKAPYFLNFNFLTNLLHFQFFIVEIINNNRMLGGRFLLLALALIVSMATNDLPYCSRSFTPQEWQKEGESYLLNIVELEKHLQPQPYFFSKLTRLATGSPQSFLELVRTAVAKVLPLNGLYLSICALVLLLMLAFYFSRKKHEFSEIPLFNQLLAEKARTSKYLKLGIVFLLVLAAVFSLKGISEASRQEKAINHIICRMVSTKNIFQKNNTQIENEQLQAYINNFVSKISANNFVEMNALQKKQRIAEYPRKNIEAIIRALQAQSYKGSVLQQLHDANKTLQFVSTFILNSSVTYEYECRQKAIFFWFEIFKYNDITERLFDAARKDRIKDVQLEEFPQNATILGKVCFVTILGIAIAACFLILREEDQDKWLVHLDWLRFVLSVIVLVCFITVIVTTLFLSFNLWIYQGEKEFFSNTSSCYNTFSVFPNKMYGGVCRFLSPASNETKYRSLSPFTSELCHSTYDEYNQMARPYLSKNQSYFYDLMASSAQEIRNLTSKDEILEKIESRYSKFPMIPIMKDTERHLVFSINLEDEIQSENISIREFFEDLGKVITINTGNSAYAVRYICKSLSITLILVLLLSNLAKWLADSVAGSRLKEREQVQQSSLNEIDSI